MVSIVSRVRIHPFFPLNVEGIETQRGRGEHFSGFTHNPHHLIFDSVTPFPKALSGHEERVSTVVSLGSRVVADVARGVYLHDRSI